MGCIDNCLGLTDRPMIEVHAIRFKRIFKLPGEMPHA